MNWLGKKPTKPHLQINLEPAKEQQDLKGGRSLNKYQERSILLPEVNI